MSEQIERAEAARLCELAAVRLRGGSPDRIASLTITERALIETIARVAIDAERELRETNQAEK